jgi:hypothetical protein
VSISAGGKTFNKGESVSYDSREFIVVGKSKDNPPGLILKAANGRQFAIGAAAVAGKVSKIAKQEAPAQQMQSPPQQMQAPAGYSQQPSPMRSQRGGYNYTQYPQQYQQTPVQQYVQGAHDNATGFMDKFRNLMSSKGGKRESEQVSRASYEIVIFLAIIVHVLDAFWLSFAVTKVTIGYRILMYFFLSLAVHILLNRGVPLKSSLLELFKVSAIPLFVVPFISVILRYFNVPENAVDVISGLTLAFPVWLYYLMYMRGESLPVEGTFWHKFFMTIFTPSGWAKIWFFVLAIAVLFNMSMLLGVQLTEFPGMESSGFDVKTSVNTLGTFSISTFEKMANVITGFVKGITTGFDNWKNESLGEYYRGEVEETKKLTGIFIKDFDANGEVYDNMPLTAYAYIYARSFVENISIEVTCLAVNTANKSLIYQGVAKPERIANIHIEDQRGILCQFENYEGRKGLPAGKYQVYVLLNFNFETWAYKQYYFMDRNYLLYLNSNGLNPNTKENIPLTTKSVYTSGPVMMGINDKIEMPFAVSYAEDSYMPIGMTIENKMLTYNAKGNVVRVNRYDLRLPNAIKVDTSACNIAPSNIVSTADNLSGYTKYTFNIPADSLTGSYMTVNCNLIIPKDEVKNLLPGTNSAARATIVGTAAYNYNLSSMITVTVKKSGQY